MIKNIVRKIEGDRERRCFAHSKVTHVLFDNDKISSVIVNDEYKVNATDFIFTIGYDYSMKLLNFRHNRQPVSDSFDFLFVGFDNNLEDKLPK